MARQITVHSGIRKTSECLRNIYVHFSRFVVCWGLTLYQQLWSYYGGSKFGTYSVFDD